MSRLQAVPHPAQTGAAASGRPSRFARRKKAAGFFTLAASNKSVVGRTGKAFVKLVTVSAL
jgi:hypothetical protein